VRVWWCTWGLTCGVQLEGPWALGDLAATLGDRAALDQLLAQFALLETAAKLRVLLGIVAVRRAVLTTTAVNDRMDRLLALAAADADPWVRTVAQLLAPVPYAARAATRSADPESVLEATVADLLTRRTTCTPHASCLA
jgi:hypothetical protein